MKITSTIGEYRALRKQLVDDLGGTLQRPAQITFVPTMGALHAGHRALLELARTRGDLVVVSIFVNPLQFGPNEDLDRYPRSLEADLELCEAAGANVVFAPSVDELYPGGHQVTVSAGSIGTVFEGRTRPGHFDGMLTVVLKLFHIIEPDVAIFGQKDAQQFACISAMVRDLNLGLEVVAAPTIRDPDGLALSSRNRFLSAAERDQALALSGALRSANGKRGAAEALEAALAVLSAAAEQSKTPRARDSSGTFTLDYAAVVDPVTFTELAEDDPGPALLVVAARVGTTRLIDNALIDLAPAG